MVNLSNGTPVSHAGEGDVFRKKTYLWLEFGFFQLFFHCWIVGTHCSYIIYICTVIMTIIYMCSSCILYLYWVRSNQIIRIYSFNNYNYIYTCFFKISNKIFAVFSMTIGASISKRDSGLVFAKIFVYGRSDLQKRLGWPPIPAIHSGSRLFEFTPNEEIFPPK